MNSMFPFTASSKELENIGQNLPVFKELAYDYENNCLLRSGGRPYLVEKDEALKIWIYKALSSKRFVWPAYTHTYGSEIESVIGLSNDPGIIDLELKRYITETLMVNPYIQELSEFSFIHEKNCVFIEFTVITEYGRFHYESEVYNE